MLSVHRITSRSYFKETVKEAVGITAVLEFVVGLYSYSLLVELVQVPFVAILTGLAVVAGTDPKYASAKRFADFLLAAIGLTSFGFSIYHIVAHFGDIATWSTIREFFDPIALTISFLPFLYLLFVYMSYENEYMALNLAFSDDHLKRYARWEAVAGFRFDLVALSRWRREFMRTRPDTTEAVRKSINDIKVRMARERRPLPVPPEDGWSPYIAKDFLTSEGVPTDDYHPSLDEWYAQSRLIDVDQGRMLANNLNFCVEGNEAAVKRLKLELNINQPSEAERAEDRFQELSRVLLKKALPEVPDKIERGLQSLITMDEHFRNQWRVKLNRDNFGGGIPGGYSRTLVIEISR
jgi:hypothetical protein